MYRSTFLSGILFLLPEELPLMFLVVQVCSYELSLFLSFLKDIFTGCGITGSQDILSAHYRGMFGWLLVCGVEAVWSGAALGLGLLFQFPVLYLHLPIPVALP